MKGSSDILSNLALHHNSQFRCRQPKAIINCVSCIAWDATNIHYNGHNIS